MTRACIAVLPLVLLLGACGQGSSPPPSSAPAAAPRAAAAAPAPATTWTKRFFIGRWAAREDMCGQPWIITDGGLSTPGEVSCRFRGLSDTPAGAEADARCTAEGPPRPYRLTFSYAQSARALLIEGGPFRDVGLVRCGDAPPPVEPRPPGTPGGLPDDRTPVSEAPFSATSAQGAANVVQVYFASVSDGDFGKAWRQLRPEARATFGGEAAFRKRFSAYQDYHAQVGGPGPIKGAAGSLYVDVPVQVYGRRRSGEEVHDRGTATLRRANDVPGSTAEQRSWRILALTVEPRF